MNCADCHQLTIDTQRQSLDSSAKWLMECAFVKDASELPRPDDINMVSYAPMCDELECEAPVRRNILLGNNKDKDEHFISMTTVHVQNVISHGTLEYPSLHAELLKGALRWAKDVVHIPEYTSLKIGPASINAAIVSNNLIFRANIGRNPPPSVDTKCLTKATEPSLDKLKKMFSTDNKDFKATISAADLIVIHVLNRGIQRVLDYADTYQTPKHVVTRKPRKSHKGKMLILGITGLICLVIGIIVKVPILILILLSLCFITPIVILSFLKGQEVVTKQEKVAWAENLQNFVNEKAHEELLKEFKSCDLINQSNKLFTNTPVYEPSLAAHLLKGVHTKPGASLALFPIAWNFVMWFKKNSTDKEKVELNDIGQDILHLSELCTKLIQNDGFSRGADIASLLLVELLHTFPNPDENSQIWKIMATSSDSEIECYETDGIPQLLVRLTRRAVSIRNNRKFWSSREGIFIERCTSLVRVLLSRPLLSNPNWHLLIIRYLGHMLKNKASYVHILGENDNTLVEMCNRVEAIKNAYDNVKESENAMGWSIKCECEKVERMEGFHASPKTEKAFLSPSHTYVRSNHKTYLDEYLNHLFGYRHVSSTLQTNESPHVQSKGSKKNKSKKKKRRKR